MQQKKVLLEIDPNLKSDVRQTLDGLAHFLLQSKPDDPVNDQPTYKLTRKYRSRTWSSISKTWRALVHHRWLSKSV